MKRTYPLVSIIMNVCNGEKFLNESLKSIFDQTYKNWELIVWDNCSTDKTKKIVKSYSDRRVKYFFSKKYSKLYKARNLALRKASGQYACFLDSDDKWDKRFIVSHLKRINQYDCDVVYSKYLVKNEKKNSVYLNEKKTLPSGSITQDLLNKYNIGIVAIMFKKKLFNKYKFDSNYQIIGDFDYFIKLSMKYKFCSLNYPLATYRFHGSNFTNKNYKIYLKELNMWLIKNNKMFLKRKYNLNNLKYFIFKFRLKYNLSKFF